MLNESTKKVLYTLKQRLPQGILLVGQRGSAFRAAVRLLIDTDAEVITVQPHLKSVVDEIQGTISIDQIRQLVSDARIKQTKQGVVVVMGAERMTQQAQNAFLKILEEPRDATVYVLCTSEPDVLLPTIRSRVQQVLLRPLTKQETNLYIDTFDVTDTTTRTQLLFMADGQPEELQKLIEDDEYYAERVKIMKSARTLLQGTLYEKVVCINGHRTYTWKTEQLIGDALQIIRHSLRSKPSNELVATMAKLHEAHEYIVGHANPRLQLLRAVI